VGGWHGSVDEDANWEGRFSVGTTDVQSKWGAANRGGKGRVWGDVCWCEKSIEKKGSCKSNEWMGGLGYKKGPGSGERKAKKQPARKGMHPIGPVQKTP